MKEKLETTLQSLESAIVCFPYIISVDDLTSYKFKYGPEKEISGPFISLALSDIHSRLTKLDQFFEERFTFTNDVKQDVILFVQNIRENFDNRLQNLIDITTKTYGVDMAGKDVNIPSVVDEICNDITKDSLRIIKFFTT